MSSARQGRPTQWTAQRILDAMRAWTRLHGQPPRYAQWRSPGAQWPSASTVCNVFGYWSAALAAAGLPSAPVGPARDELRADAACKLIADGHTQAQVARLLDCSATAVRDWLRDRGQQPTELAVVDVPQLSLFG